MEYRIEKLSLPQAREIYTAHMTRHFPAEELKPLHSIERMWAEGSYHAYGMYGPALSGYAFLASAPGCGLVLLDYFAILEPFRGKGLGGLFLRELRALLTDCQGILIETEDIDRARDGEELRARARRDLFYEKNGARKTNLRGTVYGVHYAIWNLPLSSPADDTVCRKGMEHIYQVMVPGEKNRAHVAFQTAGPGEADSPSPLGGRLPGGSDRQTPG